jgi:hypothetical protein
MNFFDFVNLVKKCNRPLSFISYEFRIFREIKLSFRVYREDYNFNCLARLIEER